MCIYIYICINILAGKDCLVRKVSLCRTTSQCCQLNMRTYGWWNPNCSCLTSLSWHLVSIEINVGDASIRVNPNVDLYNLHTYIYIYILTILWYLYYESLWLFFFFRRARHISSPRSTKALSSSGERSRRWKLSSPCKDCFLQRQAFAKSDDLSWGNLVP